jgi:HNH endonuclease
VRVYEKIGPGIWVYNGLFRLVDAWQEQSEFRNVFKFKLDLIDELISLANQGNRHVIEHNRLIPTPVKLEVWERDKGICVKCGSSNNLHFDHIIPYAKGGSSLVAANIQLLCARHNLEKSDNIE